MQTAWRKKGFVWQERKVNIDHDYAPEVLRNRKEYNEAKKLLKENMIKLQTPFPAKLRVFFPDAIRVYNTAEEATKDLADGISHHCHSAPWDTDGANSTSHLAHGWYQRDRNRDKPSYKEKLQSFKRYPDH